MMVLPLILSVLMLMMLVYSAVSTCILIIKHNLMHHKNHGVIIGQN